jgi:hypothetical protein
MPFDTLTLAHLSGILAMLGAFGYLVGDILLLAVKADITAYPKLQPHLKLLSGAEKLVVLPGWRLIWGGLVSVLVTPFYVAGLWHVAYGLLPADGWLVWPTIGLFAIGFVIAPFVHGLFVFWGEYVQALNKVDQASQHVIVAMLQRHRILLLISYGVVMVVIVLASFWFSAAVAFGETRFSSWMAFFNPVTILLLWLALRFVIGKIIPWLIDWLDGAGFNLAFLAFFALTTIAVW